MAPVYRQKPDSKDSTNRTINNNYHLPLLILIIASTTDKRNTTTLQLFLDTNSLAHTGTPVARKDILSGYFKCKLT